jgi:hypothetical protein
VSKNRRLLMWVGASIVFLGIFFRFFGSSVDLLQTRYIAWKIPDVMKVPVELADRSVSTRVGKAATFGGYDFELPWDDVVESKTKNSGRMELVKFGSGKMLLISSSAPKEFVNGFFETARWDREAFRQVYGERPVQSDYGMYRFLLNTTPSQVSFFSPRKDLTGCSMILMVKAMAMPPMSSGLFSVETNRFAGFQYGDPRKNTSRVAVELFDGAGGVEFTFEAGKRDAGRWISQGEINRVMQSVQRSTAAERLNGALKVLVQEHNQE